MSNPTNPIAVEWTDAEREAVRAAVDESTAALGFGYMESPAVQAATNAALDALARFVAERERQAAARAQPHGVAWQDRLNIICLCGVICKAIVRRSPAPLIGQTDADGDYVAQPAASAFARHLRESRADRIEREAEVERLRATVARVEALADRLARIHNRLHGDVEINGHAHLTGERDLIRRVHDDLRAALEGDR